MRRLNPLPKPHEENFSYREIPTSTTITVPDYQQMSVHEEIILYGSGDLILVGDLVVFD